jgi:hypothetical protein
MSASPRAEGNGKVRLAPERRERLRRLVAILGRHQAARALGVGIVTLECATDPYALLPERTVSRIAAAIDRVCAAD